jgi:hypothetical protein
VWPGIQPSAGKVLMVRGGLPLALDTIGEEMEARKVLLMKLHGCYYLLASRQSILHA